jgi:S-adenosylmethionine:tRNA-ribosyltransferase-isomerase (queuine synthetase)
MLFLTPQKLKVLSLMLTFVVCWIIKGTWSNVDMGQIDEHVTLAEWYAKQTQEAGSQGRRIKVRNARVIARRAGRFEILIKW